MTYKVYHFRLPVTLFVVSSTVFGHGYVFMRVSSWWRAVPEHCVYAAGKCHPSGQSFYPGAWAQPCTVISSHLLLCYDRQLRERPSNYIPMENTPLFFKKQQHIFERKKRTLTLTTRISLLALLLRSLGSHRNVLILEMKVCLFYHERTLNCIELNG